MATDPGLPTGQLLALLSGSALSASATFTPAANEHAAGDSVGVAAEFAFGAPTGATIRIISGTLRVDHATNETTAWKLHLFSITPPSALADDAAFTLAAGDRASYLGYVDFAQLVDVGATLFIEANNIQKQFTLTGTSLFGYLVNGTTLTPNAADHVVSLQAIRV